MKRQPENWWQAILAVALVVAFLVGAWSLWRWFEGYRASIWAEELRKSGVTAPVGVPR